MAKVERQLLNGETALPPISGRSAAESYGNHSSNDVLAANVAKSVVYGSGLVTPEFLAYKTSEGIHPDDAALFRRRVDGHITDILYNNPTIEADKEALKAELDEFLPRLNVSPDARKGAFLSPEDCPDDRDKWFFYPDGTAVQSHYRNCAEDPKIPYGERWTACLGEQEFSDFLQLKSMLVAEITVGPDALDRAYFYRLSQNFPDPVMNALQKIVSAESKGYYKNVRSMVGGDAAGDNRFVDKQVASWFRPWTRLAGRMEDAIDISKFDIVSTGRTFGINDLYALLESFSNLPEYQPYLQKEFKGFAANRCEDFGFNYFELPEKFRNAAGERTFIKNHPEFAPAGKAKDAEKTVKRTGPKI